MDTVALDSRLSKSTAAFLSHHRKLLINGEWVAAASGKTFPVYNPATEEQLALVAHRQRQLGMDGSLGLSQQHHSNKHLPAAPLSRPGNLSRISGKQVRRFNI